MTSPLPPGLAWRREAARLALWFERVWPALWPPLGIAGGFVCAALLGLPPLLPAWLQTALLVAVVAGIAVALWRGLRRVARPTEAEGDRRIEADSGLRHRPLTALADRPAAGSGEEALWRAHVARVTAGLTRLQVSFPRPGMAARDPRALRALVLVGLVASLGVAGASAPARLGRALWPRFATASRPAEQLQAWVTPPGYTALPPVLLAAGQRSVSVPAGSRLNVSLSGGAGGAPDLILGQNRKPFQQLDAASWQAVRDLSESGRLSIARDGRALAEWQLAVIDDVPPLVRWTATPNGARGRVPLTRLPWQASHAYGVTALAAELRLQARPGAAPLVINIPLAGDAVRNAKGVQSVDLTANPWAGLPVSAVLVGRDAAGLAGRSDAARFTLPERRFLNPQAKTIVEARKELALDPDDRGAGLRRLQGLADDGTVWENDSGGYLNLSAAMDLLRSDQSDEALAAAQDRLWQLALSLEEASPQRTAEALARARRELRAAIDALRQGQTMPPKELQRREQALERALQQHLQALQQQARRDPSRPAPSREQAERAERSLQQLQQDLDRNQRDDAGDQMAELERELQQLEQAGRGKQAEAKQQRQQGRERGKRQMSVLQDLVRRETGLLDHAQMRASAPDSTRNLLDFPPGQLDLDQSQSGASPDDSQQKRDADAAARGADQKVQHALRRALGVLMQDYGDLTGKVPPNMGSADQAMHDAEKSLGVSHDADASDAARRAIEALEEGGQSMQDQLSQQFGAGQDQAGQQEGDQDSDQADEGDQGDTGQGESGQGGRMGQYGDRRGNNGEGRQALDPFGRPLQDGLAGSDGGVETRVPETMEVGRTRAIEEELRRRGADRTRPKPELDYIDRLLQGE